MVFFKYRGTTIRLSSIKLCIAVSFVFAAVAAILTLREMISLSRNPVAPLPAWNSNIRISLNSTSPAPESKRIPITINNVNSNIFQERVRLYHTVSNRKNWSDVSPEIRQLREAVRTGNAEEHIRNAERFGKTISDETIVIVVQVHNRADYFAHLLKSLGRSRGIEDALLITSHDYYSEEINRLVESVDFCKVLQIFFPFSDQLYPNEFPGNDPNDCPRDMTRERARAVGCNNAATPDMYGHYREAKFTMTKHHWWWKANQVFEFLNATKTYTGPVLFLEEDYYVTPDIHHMLKLVYDGKKSAKDCDLITLGTYATVNDYREEGGVDAVEIIDWRSHDHNMGLAFDKATWNMIKKCSEVFCRSFDEYNWDWTVMRISASCAPRKFKSLVLKGPRVFHLGECGLHHKKSDCNVAATVEKYQDIINKNMHNFFPASIHIRPGFSREVKFSPNGGWGDPRDHALCFQIMKGRCCGKEIQSLLKRESGHFHLVSAEIAPWPI